MIPLDFTGPGDDRIPGDFRRNSQGNPLIKPPGGGRDTPYDRPSKWFDDYTGIDPIYANRGTWVHKLCEHIDNGHAWAADLEFVAAGVELGIPHDIQQDIARAWQRFLNDHQLTVVHNEHNVINDTLKMAGTLDRIVEHDGFHRVLDIKTGGKVDKTAYVVQLARYAGAVPYDVDTDQRGDWDGFIDPDVGYIAHLPLNNILKGACGVELHLVTVELADGHTAAQTLRALKALDLSDAFTIASPTNPPPVVETPDGDTVAASVSPSTLDDLRTEVKAWTAADRASLVAYFDRHDVDTADPAQVAEAMAAIQGFQDVTTVPQMRATVTASVTQRPDTPDEGSAVPDDDFDALNVIYRDYPKPDRDWIAEIAVEAKRNGLDIHTRHNRTLRRFHLMAALINLCQHPDRDQALDDTLRDIHGDVLADHNPTGILVGMCDHEQAQQLADIVTGIVKDAG